MKKNLRKMLALMLALALSLTMLQGVAFGADDYVWDDTNKILTIKTNGGTTKWHSNNSIAKTDVKTVIIQSGVTEILLDNIGQGAFLSCTNLTSVTLPAGLETIGESAFSGCTDLTSVTLPDSLETIGNAAFQSSGLTSIALPANLETIGNAAFQSTAITSINIPAGVTSIGENAFYSCDTLTTITFNGTPTTIPDDIFGLSSDKSAAPINTINFAGAYEGQDSDDMLAALKTALTTADKTPTLQYNQNDSNWEQAIKNVFVNYAGTIQSYNPTPAPPPVATTTPSGTIGSSGGGGAGVWYPGQASGGITYTQIVDETATTAMLETGSVITVTGQSPTGIIVKLDPTALSGHSTITINNSIGDVTLTATQIANLIQQADGDVIHVTIKQTADGVAVTATAGGQVVTL